MSKLALLEYSLWALAGVLATIAVVIYIGSTYLW